VNDLSFKFPFLATCGIGIEDLGSSVSMLVSMTGTEGPRLLVLKLGIVLERTNTWVSTCRLSIPNSSVWVELKITAPPLLEKKDKTWNLLGFL